MVTLTLWAAMLAWAADFTVDDALISLRYAQHIAHGLGPRWNVDGPLSDGVTPLPWPWLLAPLSHGVDLWTALTRARWLSVACASAAALLAARALSREGAPLWAKSLILLPFPWAAWALSGMESSSAALLLTAAACLQPGAASALCAGLAATLRPELLPAAAVLAWGRAWQAQREMPVQTPAPAALLRICIVQLLLVLGPFALVVLVRLWLFSAPAPLSLIAKPSDLSHGARYALAAALSCGTPLLLFARVRRGQWPLAVAAWTQLLVVLIVGGDWMPYARLLVPVLPLFPLFCDFRARRSQALCALALLCALGIGWRASQAARGVLPQRRTASEQLARARPPLPIAALDIGLVAAAVGEGSVVDLGGLTDRELAHLPGGLSSKRVRLDHLERRGVQSLLSWGEHGSRVVEQRLLQDPRFLRSFDGEPIGELGGRPLWLWRRRSQPRED